MPGLANTIWRESEEQASQYILYTEDASLAGKIRRWGSHNDGRIRPMAEYYKSLHHQRPYAWQFRFGWKLANRVARRAHTVAPKRMGRAHATACRIA